MKTKTTLLKSALLCTAALFSFSISQAQTLVAHYEFDGDHTSSGGTYTQTLVATPGDNTISFVNDNNEQATSAVDVSGTAQNSAIISPTNFPISGDDSRTITAWIKIPSGGDTNRIIAEIGRHQGGDGNRFSLTIQAAETLSLGIRGGSVTTSNSVPEDTWVFVAATCAGDGNVGSNTDVVNVYISPTGPTNTISTPDATGSLDILTEANNPLRVASGTQGGSRTFYGSIADLRIYDGVLTASQLNAVKGGATLGTEDIAFAKNELKAFPTAVEDYLNIETTLSGRPHITVYNMVGKTVKKAFSERVDMSDLSTGLYIVNVRVGNKVGNLKVIKK